MSGVSKFLSAIISLQGVAAPEYMEGGICMSELPVPGNVFFSDFAGEVVNYHLERAGTVISVVRGIPNRENRKSVIHFEFKSGI